MNQEQLEQKLEDENLKFEEISHFCANVLNNLFDEGSTITSNDSNLVVSAAGEKLDVVISMLIKMKKGVDLTEKIQNWMLKE